MIFCVLPWWDPMKGSEDGHLLNSRALIGALVVLIILFFGDRLHKRRNGTIMMMIVPHSNLQIFQQTFFVFFVPSSCLLTLFLSCGKCGIIGSLDITLHLCTVRERQRHHAPHTQSSHSLFSLCLHSSLFFKIFFRENGGGIKLCFKIKRTYC